MIKLSKNKEGLEFLVDANLEAAHTARDVIVGLANFGENNFGIRLGLDEAMINAIKHGNKYSGEIKVSYSDFGEYVRVKIEDSGEGFNPSSVPDPVAIENLEKPSGRGIMLMKAYAQRVEYNSKGNCVTLDFYRKPNEKKISKDKTP